MSTFPKEKKKEKSQLAFRSPLNQQKRGTFLTPPPLNLTASAIQAKKDTEVRTVPEKTGAVQEGPLAVKGAGDLHSMDASDINQGSIGDCFLLAGIGAVAHSSPGLLEKAIKDNQDGTYTVTLYGREKDKIGKTKADSSTSRFTKLVPKSITITADFPTAVNGKDTANSGDLSDTAPHATGGDKNAKGQTELWVRLIEKAYAVLCGSYKAIGNGGYSENAMEALTGKQFTERAFSSGKRLKNRLIEATKKSQPATVSTKGQGDIDKQAADLVEFAENNDIVGGHAYMMLEATEDGIKIRNPWGSGAVNATPTLTWDQFAAFFDQTATQN